MNINESIRNKRKYVEKLRGIATKLPICLLPTIVDCETWYQIQVETLHFDQNDYIYELSNLNIHE